MLPFAHRRNAFLTHRCDSLGCVVLHDIYRTFGVSFLQTVFAIASVEGIIINHVLDIIINAAVARILS